MFKYKNKQYLYINNNNNLSINYNTGIISIKHNSNKIDNSVVLNNINNLNISVTGFYG